MSLSNFLPISRQLQEHWIYKDSCYLHCWLEMLFNARYADEEKTDIYKGVVYTINRGEFIFSRPTYSNRLNIPEGKIRTLMKLLISENMIEEVKSLGRNKPTIYKICNYEMYNCRPNEPVDFTDGPAIVDQVTTKSQPSDNQVTTKSQPLKNIDNIDKKEKKKEKTFSSDSIEYGLAYKLFSRMRSNNPKVKEPNFQVWAKHIDLMIRIDGRQIEDIEKVIDWCQRDSFWKCNILSTAKLREKFDQLYIKVGKFDTTSKETRLGIPPCESILPERDDDPWF